VLPLDEATEGVRDLEPPFVIDFGSVVAPEHGWLLHFAPQISTPILENTGWVVNRKSKKMLELRFIFARRRFRRKAPVVLPPRATMCRSDSRPAARRPSEF
jgi:hypothetical protein